MGTIVTCPGCRKPGNGNRADNTQQDHQDEAGQDQEDKQSRRRFLVPRNLHAPAFHADLLFVSHVAAAYPAVTYRMHFHYPSRSAFPHRHVSLSGRVQCHAESNGDADSPAGTGQSDAWQAMIYPVFAKFNNSNLFSCNRNFYCFPACIDRSASVAVKLQALQPLHNESRECLTFCWRGDLFLY